MSTLSPYHMVLVMGLLAAGFFCQGTASAQTNANQPSSKTTLVDSVVIRRAESLLDSGNAVNEHPEQQLQFVLRAQLLEATLPPVSLVRERLYRDLATALSNLDDHGAAVESIRTELQIHHQRMQTPTIMAYIELGRMGGNFMAQRQWDSTRAVYSRALHTATALNDTVYIAAALNNIGFAHERFGLEDSAKAYYRQALATVESNATPDADLQGNIIENMARLSLAAGDWPQALAMYEQSFALSKTDDDIKPHITVRWGLAEANIMLAHGQPERARTYLQDVEAVLYSSNYNHRKRDRLLLWKAWRTYYGLTGNRKQEMRFIDLVTEQAEQQLEQSQQLQQEYIDALNSYRLASIRQRLEVNDRLIQQKAAEVQVLEERATLRNMWIIFLVVISLITLVTLTRYFLKRNKYQRMQEQMLALQIRNRQLENEQLRKEAVEQKQELAHVGAQNAQQRARADHVLQQLKTLKGATSTQQDSAIDELIAAIRAQQEVASDNATLQEGVDSVHQEFYTRLEERFPTLTKSEKELCGLIRLELSGKEIANLRHVDPRSVTKSKNRLRKKLGLAPYEDLYQFLKAF